MADEWAPVHGALLGADRGGCACDRSGYHERQPRLDGDGGPKSMKAESRRSNPALDVVRVSDIVST
jgi:hypothetical protein